MAPASGAIIYNTYVSMMCIARTSSHANCLHINYSESLAIDFAGALKANACARVMFSIFSQESIQIGRENLMGD